MWEKERVLKEEKEKTKLRDRESVETYSCQSEN